MGYQFNPFTSNFDIVGSGSSQAWLPAVQHESNLPTSAIDGAAIVVLDTDRVYVYKLSSTKWVDTGETVASFSATANSNGLLATLDSSGSIIRNTIALTAANATNPGGVSTTTQTFAGSKTFSSLLNADGGIDRSVNGTLTIGATNSSVINIGNSGSTVNILGTVLYENVTQVQVKDPLITLNKGGGIGSAQNSGIELEENGIITGYAETSSDRNSWILKAPNTAGIATIVPGTSGITLDQSSHNPVTIGTANGLSLSTQALSLALANSTTTGALSSTDWNTFNNKQSALTLGNLTSSDLTVTGGTGAIIGSGVTLTLNTVPINKGGTNGTATPTAGAVAYGTGTAYGFTTAGTVGQFLQSNGSGSPTWASPTSNIGSTGYFGAFQDNFNQTITSTTTAYAILLRTTDINNGVSIQNDLSSNPTQITFANAGTYSTTFSIQFANSDNSSVQTANVWLRLNGVDVVESNSQITVPTKHTGVDGAIIMTINFMNTLNAGDYLQVMWSGTSTQLYIAAFAAGSSPTTPATPGVILTTQQLAQIGLGYAGLTSATSTLIGTGSKTFTTNLTASQTAFAIGTRVRLAYSVTPANFMEGVITAFTGTSMTVNVDTIGGSGTFASWNVSVTANSSTLGTVAIANGGTGQTTQQTAINALAGAVTSGQYLRGNGTNVLMSAIQAADVPTLNQSTTGSAGSISGTNVITNTNLSQMSANTIKGNNTAGTANAADLTATQVTAMLNQFTSTLQGVVPLSGGGTTNFLRADGTWASPSGTGVTSISVNSSNGFSGSSSGGTTPALTLGTTITGILKGNGTAISAATAGTDYVIPSGNISGTAANITATSNSTLTTLSALSLPGSQVSGNISGNAANVTGTVAIANGGTGQTTAQAALKSLSTWATGASYVVGQQVTYGTGLFVCMVAHTASATIEADMSSGYWAYLNRQAEVSPNLFLAGTNFENASVGGWQLFNISGYSAGTVPSSAPTLGTAASMAVASTSTGAISNKNSLSLTNTASTNFTAGQGIISPICAVDPVNQAKTLSVQYAYQAAAGAANMSFPGTSSGTWAMYIYDVTNSAWIQPAGVYNLVQNSGVGVSKGNTWQTPSNMTQFRVAFLCVNSSTATTPAAGALQMLFDDFYVGPQITSSGPALSDWNTYSFTLQGSTTNPTLGTLATNVAMWKREGSDMVINIVVRQTTAGTAGSGVYLFPLPSGYSIDTTKITVNSTIGIGYQFEDSYCGTFAYSDANNDGYGNVTAYDSTRLRAQMTYAGTSSSRTSFNSSTTPMTTTALAFSISARVPIAGWSSNSVMSADVDTRTVAFSATNTSTVSTTITTLTANWTTVIDTHNAFSGGTWTCPSSDVYTITASVGAGASTSTTQSFILVNGSTVRSALSYSAAVGSGVAVAQYTARLTAGQTVQMQAYSSGGGTASAPQTYLQITKAAGNPIIAATESISASYSNTAGTSITSTAATVIFANKYWDSHGAYNTSTGVYTVPAPGKYRISVNLIETATLGNNGGFTTYAVQTGSTSVTKMINNAIGQSGVANNVSSSGSVTFNCVTGDTLVIQASSTATGTLMTNAGYNHFEIERVGN